MPGRRSERVVLEANTAYWDPSRMPRVKRIVFDNTLSQAEAIELLKRGDPRVDLVTGLSPLETRRVSQSSSATVVKNRDGLTMIFGQFNLRKPGSPWQDVRLRRAANLAINRADLIRYAANGNGMVVSAVIPAGSVGHDPELAPYPFNPAQARELLREAGHPNGLALALIAPRTLEIQATVVAKMLEQAGFQVTRQVLERPDYDRKTNLPFLDGPAEQQTWDIALATWGNDRDFPLFAVYHHFAMGAWGWGLQEVLRPQYDQALRTVDRDRHERLLRQLERHTSEQAYFLFLYSPIILSAVNRAVRYAPQADVARVLGTDLVLTDQHWSVRPGARTP